MNNKGLHISKALDAAEKCASRGRAAFTDFYDPVKTAEMVKAVTENYNDITVRTYGGALFAERAVIGVFPAFTDEYAESAEPFEESFPIERVKITYSSKNITHRDVLGAILGIPVNRDKIGDIIVRDGVSYAFVKTEILDFIINGLPAVGRTPVSCERVDFFEINSPGSETEETRAFASARADCVAAGCFGKSRSETAEDAARGRIFLNWEAVKSGSADVKEGDVLTLRGAGRVKIISLAPRSKKDGFTIKYIKY